MSLYNSIEHRLYFLNSLVSIEIFLLIQDLENFPYGDSTIVGDNGVILSGGQKARLSLARALYRDGDVYLLDDPLSAVDVEVARHIVEKYVERIMKN